MKLKPADLLTLIRGAALAFGQDKAPRLAAAIAYYAIFSIAPLLVFAVAVAGFFLSDGAVIQQLFGPGSLVAQNLGPQAAEFLRDLLNNQEGIQRGSVWASVIAFVILFMGATGLFVQIQDALNSMWGADPAPPQGLLAVARTRILAFLMIVLIGVLLLAFLGFNTYLSAIAQNLGDRIGAGAFFVRLGTLILSVLFLTPMFAAIYKLLPAVKLEWRDVGVGGAVTATLFTLGQLLIGLYFGQAAPGSAFAAAGTLVTLLLWIYYSAMIFFFGAEVTWVYSQKYGSRAGGAGNVAKKQAVADKGAEISTAPSPQEAEAAAHADRPVRDARGRVVAGPQVPGREQGAGKPRRALPWPLTRLPAPRRPRAPESQVPSVGGALWNALSAVLALPAVIVLRLLGWTGRKK
ncbi:YihY/virulence factor BrkB family protein [Deinococcus petrolearius]|uniref:YihY/virulence factor BrkB family protein n=1 Tax=Deinococcus petrolearius TaxID=1751295 RepID=A0ABW1DNZ1_9DEIO